MLLKNLNMVKILNIIQLLPLLQKDWDEFAFGSLLTTRPQLLLSLRSSKLG